MENIKKMIIITMIIFSLALMGCWDKVEINERAFVTAVGVDTTPDDDTSEGEIDIEGGDRYTVTYVFPNIAALGKQGKGEPKFVISSKGMSPYETTRLVRTRLHQGLYFSHMKVLIIGEDVAKNSDMLKEILDSVERNNTISRKINVMVTKGTAKEILNVESQYELDIGLYLSNIFEASTQTARFNPLTLGELLVDLHIEEDALMPRVSPGEKDLKVAGSGVIKNYKLIGWLGEVENRSVMFLLGRIKSDVVVVAPFKDKIIIPYEITESKTKKTAQIEEGRLKVSFMIEMEGDLNQYIMDSPEDVLDDKVLKEVENSVEKYLKTKILETVEKLQKEFKVDLIGVNEYLSKFKPDIWAEVEGDWETLFPDIEIEIQVDAKIRRIGVTK